MQFRGKYENSWFKAGPVLGRPVSGWRYTKPVITLEKCNDCGWCFLYCPTGCIKEEDEHFVINLDFCKGCGICAHECPKGAIEIVDEEAE